MISLVDYHSVFGHCQLWMSLRSMEPECPADEALVLRLALVPLVTALNKLAGVRFYISPRHAMERSEHAEIVTFDQMCWLFSKTNHELVDVHDMDEHTVNLLNEVFPHLREAERILLTHYRKGVRRPYEPPAVTTTRDATDDEIACAVQAVEFRAAVDQARTYPALAALATQKALDDRNDVTLAAVEARARELGLVRIAITLGRDATIIELIGPGTKTVVTKRPFAEVLPEALGMVAPRQQEAQTQFGWWPHRGVNS